MIENSNHWIIEQSKKNSDISSIICENKTFTFSELFNEVKKYSSFFLESGLSKNSHVAILLNHSYEFYIIINSLWIIGCVVVPINPKIKLEELEYQINKADVRFLITKKNIQPKIDNNINFIFIDEITNNSISFSLIKYNKDNNALIMFTSGSTDKPKAVVHTFSSLYEHVVSFNKKFKLATEDKWLASLPLYHIGGFMILIRSLISGCTVIFPNSLDIHDIEKSFLYLPTNASFVTTMIIKSFNEQIKFPKSLKNIFIGGGPVDFNFYELCKKNSLDIIKVYGSTETCSMITALLPDDNKINSVGKVIDESNSILIAKNNNEDFGEILVKSNTLFKEYYNDVEYTKTKFENGFLKTSDFGYLDKDNYLYITGRKEDFIISGGINISRIEIENAIKKIKNVKDAFVFGIKDEYWGEQVCTAIVASDLTQNEIISYLKKNLSSFKIPKKIYFVESLPRNEMGKISKSKILQLLNLNDN